VIVQNDNARPHTTDTTRAAIRELDWEILPRPAYYPDLASSDYHIFHSLSNNLRGVSFNSNAELQNWLDEFFTTKINSAEDVLDFLLTFMKDVRDSN
jgi:hypothetical protein